MRIGIVVEYLHARGGTQRQGLALARELARRGHRVEVFCGVLNRDTCFPDLMQGLTIRTATEVGGQVSRGARRLPRAAMGVARSLGRGSGAVYAAQWAVMERSSRRLAKLLERGMHRFDVLNPHDFGPAAWAASASGKGVPVVWQCNDPLLRWDNGTGILARHLREALIAYDRRRLRSIACATVLDSKVARVVGGRYDTKVRVVRTGVESARFEELPGQGEARAELGVKWGGRVALVLSILNSPHRRVEDAVAAHAAGPKDVLLLLAAVGDHEGAYPKMVEAVIGRSPARDRIFWIRRPLNGDEELLLLLGAADVLVFPNVQQTWGLAVIEAAAAGVPAVVSDDSGVSEVLEDGRTCYKYHGGDPAALEAALARAWSDDEGRLSVGLRARAEVRERYSWARYASEMEAIFQEAAGLRAP